LDFPFNHAAASMMLMELEEKLSRSGKRFKARLGLSFQGVFNVTYEPVEVPNSRMPVKICLASDKTESSQPLLYHKTTSREHYDSHYSLARKKGYDEVFFLNEHEELTEGTISNIFIRKGRHFFTPPLHSGLLNGIFRQYFLATRLFASEKTLTLHDVIEADMIYIANSVRGLRPAVFNGDQITL
jgi:para-aminobenzoate synthetase/4-amino-4-deoxychorismate lyase